MMKQMGMSMAPVEGVREVVLKLPGKRVVLEDPEVFVVEMGGQRIYQVMPGAIREEAALEEKPTIPEEDVLLVAQQAGVSPEEAREALEKTGGDLARAILLLTGQEA